MPGISSVNNKIRCKKNLCRKMNWLSVYLGILSIIFLVISIVNYIKDTNKSDKRFWEIFGLGSLSVLSAFISIPMLYLSYND